MPLEASRGPEQFPSSAEYSAYLSSLRFGEYSGRLIGTMILQDLEKQEAEDVLDEFDTAFTELRHDHAELGVKYIELARLSDQHIEVKDQRIEDLKRTALIDPDTQLWNKRGLEKQYEQLTGYYRRRFPSATSAGVILFADLDDFGSINEALGHQAADRLVVELSQKMQQRLRSTDILGRYGGDEFIALLPDSSLENGKKIADALLEQVSGKYAVDGNPVDVSLSIGVDIIEPTSDFSMGPLGANKAMYQAKKNGKAQVVIAPQQADIFDQSLGEL